MGMFDTVYCLHPLPQGAAWVGPLQTKSLSCDMQEYVLNAAGRLLRADGSDTQFHGVMRLHGQLSSAQWIVLEAKFSNGALVHLVGLAQARYDDCGMCPPAEANR